MIKKIIFFLVFFSVFSCSNTKQTQLNFLDEYILKDSILFKNSIIGGLSGIDYANGSYYLVVDDVRNPRFLKADIQIQDNKIKSVIPKEVYYLNDTSTVFYKENSLDLESVFVDEKTKETYFVSEGSIKRNRLPTFFKTDSVGKFKANFKLPENISNLENIKHNSALEGSSKSINKKGFWIAMEEPLKVDGVEATFKKTSSPIRITYFDRTLKKATKQFAYQLESIEKSPKGNLNINGVTAILEYKENSFFVVERTYQSGFGAYGNVIRIFDAVIDESSTNILATESLKKSKFIPLKKRLLLDFDSIRSELTTGIVDNIEGITFGPKLPNGNQSLVLVSDDNFQIYGKQLNQFILLEIDDK